MPLTCWYFSAGMLPKLSAFSWITIAVLVPASSSSAVKASVVGHQLRRAVAADLQRAQVAAGGMPGMPFGLEVPTGTGEVAFTGADLMDVQAMETGVSSPGVVVSTVTVALAVGELDGGGGHLGAVRGRQVRRSGSRHWWRPLPEP